MNVLFSSAWRKTVLLCSFVFLTAFLTAQTCNVTGPSKACVDGMSEYHVVVNVQSDYNINWKVLPPSSGTLVMPDNEMTMVHWLTAGISQVVAEVRSPSGGLITTCSVSPAVDVMTFPNPEIVPEYAPDMGSCIDQGQFAQQTTTAYCGGSTRTFYPNGSGGTYTWEVTGNILSSTVDPVTHYLTVQMGHSGMVHISLTETNAAGCSRKTEEEYRLYEPPTSSFTEISHGTLSPIHICKGEDLLFFGNYSDPNDLLLGGWVWTVTPENSNVPVYGSGSDQQFAYTFNQSGTYKVNLYATNCLGCSSPTTSVTVEVGLDPGPAISCPSVVCQGTTPVRYCADLTCTSYVWTVVGGTPQGNTTGQCIDVVWNTPLPGGYGSVTLQVPNCQPGGGVCTEPVTVEVPVIPPVTTIDGPAGLCNPDAENVQYSVPYWPGANYTWSFVIDQNQSGGYIGIAGAGHEALISLHNFYGKYRVRVVVTHPVANCSSTGELAVSTQDYHIEGNGGCFGNDVALSILPSSSLPPSYKVEWSVVETNAPVVTMNNSPNVTLPFSAFGSSGSFTVKAVIIPTNGQPFACDDLIHSVSIAAEVPAATAIAGAREFCLPSSQIYTAAPGAPAGSTFTWTATGGTFPMGNTGTTVKVDWAAAQPSYTLSVIRTFNGCTSAPYAVSDFLDVTGQTPVIIGDPSMSCEGGTVTFTSSIDGASSYNWQIIPSTAGSIISGAGTPQIEVLWHAFGLAKIRLVSKICNVNYTALLEVPVIQNSVSIKCPNQFQSNPCQLCDGTDYTFTTNNNNGSYYKWYVDGANTPNLEGTTAKEFTTKFEGPGTHFVRVEMTGSAACPGTFGDVLSVEVVANPSVGVFPTEVLDCQKLNSLTLNATTWPGASLEIFSWQVNGQNIDNLAPTFPVYQNNPTASAVMTIMSPNQADYEATFLVSVERILASGMVCRSQREYTPHCSGSEVLPHEHPNVIFTDWNFNLGVVNADCQPNTANECGYIQVSGSLNGKSLNDVAQAQWFVQDPFGTVTPNPYAILQPSDLDNASLSVFSRAGFYPTALRVRFLGDATVYNDVRVLELPLVPDIAYTYGCGTTPGTYNLVLSDASETVPNAIIHQRQWVIQVNGVPQVVNDVSEVTLSVPAGATVVVSLTPYTFTVGPEKPGMLYYCTRCMTINLPPSPTVEIEADRETACTNVPIDFSAEITPPTEPIINYSWNFGDAATDHTPSPSRTYLSSGVYTVSLTATTQRGCELQVTKQIEVVDNALDGSISLMYMNCNSSATLTFDPGMAPAPDTYLWGPGGQTMSMITVDNVGNYDVTVSDMATGCTFSPPAVQVTLQSLFPGGLTGSFSACKGDPLSFSYTSSPGYTYTWETNLVGTSIVVNKLNVTGNNPPGTYYVKVKAYDAGNNFCTSIMEEVVIHIPPSLPTIQVEYTCDPFVAHLTTVPSTSVAWSGPNGNIGFGSEIFANEGGTYTVLQTNQYGCRATTDVTVKDAIDVSILSGCYSICDNELDDGDICLPAPAGSYTSWMWKLLPNTTLKSGTGAVQPLCLNASMEGKIVLLITQEYHNPTPPPNGSVLTCNATSDPFCLDVLDCYTCPTPLTVGYNSMLSGGGTPVICGAFTEHIFAVKGFLTMPAGFKDCGHAPVLTGGYFNFTTYYVNPQSGSIFFEGFLHVTDFNDFANGGLSATIILCDKVTGNECPAKFTVPNIPCMPGMDFNCNPQTTSTMWGPYTTPQLNNKLKVRYCFNLHYVSGTPCSINQYTVTINTPTTPSTVLAQQTFTSTQLPSDQYQCLEFLIDAYRWTAYGGCVNVSIASNCAESACNWNNFCGHTGYGLQAGGGGDDRATASPAGLIPEGYLSVIPNPASDLLTIGCTPSRPAESSRVIVTNGLGQVIRTLRIDQPGGTEQIDVSDWPGGLYFVHLSEGGRVTRSQKVVIQH